MVCLKDFNTCRDTQALDCPSKPVFESCPFKADKVAEIKEVEDNLEEKIILEERRKTIVVEGQEIPILGVVKTYSEKVVGTWGVFPWSNKEELPNGQKVGMILKR